MADAFFSRLDPLLICLVLTALMLMAAEAGFRAMKRKRPDAMKVENTDIALILGAVLTLLSLMLGFTYAMSQGRYETRRQLVIEEADAIGTAFLRAKTLSEPRSSELQDLLRQYAALRVEMGTARVLSPEKVQEFDARSKKLHEAMWSRAAALAEESPGPIISIFLQALNEMIDLHAKRLAAFRSRVPVSIYLVLFGISVAALGLIGYYSGTRHRRIWNLSLIFGLLVAAVMWLIMDLDNPARGFIKTSQQSIIDLQRDLGPPARDGIKQ